MTPQLVIQSGIYTIRNQIDGKLYIGSSVSVRERLTEHRQQLEAMKHPNSHLQAAWLKYGPSVFLFAPLRSCEPQRLLEEEQLELDLHAAKCGWAGLYNLSRSASAPMYGRRHSDESRLKISAARKVGKRNMLGKKHSEETRTRMREAALGQAHPHSGHKLSAETRAKISALMFRQKKKYGAENHFYGKCHTEESKARISAARKGRPWSEKRRAAWRAKQCSQV